MTNNISEMLASTMSKIQQMVDVNTIVGKAITVGDGVTIIAISKVHIGMGGGGSDFTTKSSIAAKKDPCGGGMGAGVTVDPVAFLVIRGDNVRMLPVAEPASTTMDRLIEQGPELLDKLAGFMDSRKPKDNV